MASGGLHLFPQIPPAGPTGKEGFYQTSRVPASTTSAGFQGVAFHVTSRRPQPRIRPAVEAIKHSPPSGPSISSEVTSPIQTASDVSVSNNAKDQAMASRTRTKRPSNLDLSGTLSVEAGEDQLSPLPQKSDLKPRPRSARKSALETKNRHVPHKISVVVVPDVELPTSPTHDGGDQLSPLPSRTCFKLTSPSASEFSVSPSVRSGSPTLVGSAGSSAFGSPSSPIRGSAMRSIFPRYDPTRALNQQSYFPTTRAPSRTEYVPEQFSRVASPDPTTVSRGMNPAFGLVDGFEHVPIAERDDLQALWEISRMTKPSQCRKVQFKLLQAPGSFLAVGTSSKDVVFSMASDEFQFHLQDSPAHKQLVVKKTSPDTFSSSSTVAQIPLPSRPKNPTSRLQPTPIFPQAAALSAIEAMPSQSGRPSSASSASSRKRSIFRSSRASKFAKSQSAIVQAQQQHTCSLTKITRQRDSLGSVTATYILDHPSKGPFTIAVSKSQHPQSRTGPRAKIALFPPSPSSASRPASPSSSSASSTPSSLAFFDFAYDACVIDIPLFLALDTPYLMDTCLSALFAVAAIEDEALLAETIVFAAPPRAPIKNKSKSMPTTLPSSSKKTSRSSFRAPKPSKTLPSFPLSKSYPRPSASLTKTPAPSQLKKSPSSEQSVALTPAPAPTSSFPLGEQVDLPFFTQSALTIVNVSFKSTHWLLNLGAKASSSAIVGANGVGKKV